MKKIYLSILLVFSCASPSLSAVHVKHFNYPSNQVNVYKIESTTIEYKLPPAVVRDDSITIKYLSPRSKPPVRKAHNFSIRRF